MDNQEKEWRWLEKNYDYHKELFQQSERAVLTNSTRYDVLIILLATGILYAVFQTKACSGLEFIFVLGVSIGEGLSIVANVLGFYLAIKLTEGSRGRTAMYMSKIISNYSPDKVEILKIENEKIKLRRSGTIENMRKAEVLSLLLSLVLFITLQLIKVY